jgi:hypothetical protein
VDDAVRVVDVSAVPRVRAELLELGRVDAALGRPVVGGRGKDLHAGRREVSQKPHEDDRRARRAEWFAFLQKRRDLASIEASQGNATDAAIAEARDAERELHAALFASDEDEWFEIRA